MRLLQPLAKTVVNQSAQMTKGLRRFWVTDSLPAGTFVVIGLEGEAE